MDVSTEIAILIALASLAVSVISVAYARKAYRFEVNKFRIEQAKKEFVIELEKNVIAELRDHYIILSEFNIQNGTQATAYIRYLTIWLYFKDNSQMLPKYMRICLNPSGGRCGGSFPSMKISDTIDAMGGIETVVVDINTKNRLTFSPTNMVKIDSVPQSYAWKAITVIPKNLLNELYANYLKLDRVEIVSILHPEQQKEGSSTKFPFVLMPQYDETITLDELSSLFPKYTFRYN
ncbi:MAG: hypothetical protein IH589_06675 [Anaerolineales bacterium]|nr:hypothetical protein [Anaerolineales bacterium]